MASTNSHALDAERLLDVVHEAYCRLNSEFRFTYIDPAAEALLEIPRAELIGKKLCEVCFRNTATPLEQACHRARSGNTAVSFETYHEPCQRWYSVTIMPDTSGGLVVQFLENEPNRTESQNHRCDTSPPKPNESFRNIIEHSHAGYFRIGLDGCYEDVNPAWLRMHGFSRKEEAIGLHFSAVQNPEDKPEAEETARALMQGLSIGGGEFSRLRRNGTIGYHSYSANPVFDGDKVVGIEGFLVDTTDQRAAERAEVRIARHYRSLFDNVREGVAVHKLLTSDGIPQNYVLIDVNRRYEEIVGLKRSDVVGKTATEVYGTEEAPFLSHYAQAVQSHSSLQFETYFAPLQKHFVVSIASMGEDLFATIFFDVTEQKTTEAALRQSREQMRSIANNVPGIVFQLHARDDGTQELSFIGDRLFEFFGVSPEPRSEVIQRFAAQVHPEDQERFRVSNEESIRSASDWQFEGRYIKPTGEALFVSGTGAAMRLEHETVYNGIILDITDRKNVEAQFRNIFEGALEGIYRLGADRGSLTANPALAKLLGYGSADELTFAITDVASDIWVCADERSKFLQLLASDGIVRGYECRFKRKDGTPVWVSLGSHRVKGNDGQTLYYEGFVEDISERRAAAARVDHLQKIVSTAQLAAHFGVFEWNAKTGKSQWAEETFALFGLDPQTTKPSLDAWFETVQPDDRDGVLHEFQQTLESTAGDLNIEFRSADGLRWLATKGRLYRDADGKPDRLVGINIDITDRKRADDALYESERRLREIFENTHLITAMLDKNGCITFCNDFLLSLMGCKREELLGRDWCESLVPDGQYSRELLLKQIREAAVPLHYQNEIVTRTGRHRVVSWNNTMLFDAHGEPAGVSTIGEDITERVRLENELRQAQKMECVGRLASGVAHDFNNLLTIINGYSSFLLKELEVVDPLRSYAEEISKAGDRAASLTKQLLAFSRKQIIEPRVFKLNTTIMESLSMFRRLIGEDIALEVHLDPSVGKIMADPDQIHQVLMNLVLNSRDAMPAGGELDIETMNVELHEDGASTIHADARPGSYVLVTVTDTGCGMDATVRQQIFEPFFTTKERGKGTGLGLSTVYGIVRQNGGWTDVWSEVGVGTSVKIYLPRVAETSPERANTVSTGVERGSETILLIEDQDAVRGFAATVLKQYGHKILEASSGEAAIDLAKSFSPAIHLLVTDVILPGINGKQTSELLKASRPDLKVLFISGYTADVIAQRGVLEEGVAFLHKPFTPDALAGKVRDVLASRA